jgi:hypothetical protein
MADEGALSFEKDIRPMFTDLDVAHMKPAGFDLSSYADVKEGAEAIYDVVSDGSMPPSSSGEARWTAEMCERFQRWRDQGCPP